MQALTPEEVAERTASVDGTRLTYRRPSDEKAKAGKQRKRMAVFWCDACKKEATLVVERVLNGNTRSCGCLGGPGVGTGPKPGTSRHLKRIYGDQTMSKHRRRVINGEWCRVRSDAARYAGVSQRTLAKGDKTCDQLGGQGFEPYEQPDGRGRMALYYSEAKLDRYKQARAKLRTEPPKGGRVTLQELRDERECSPDWLRRQVKATGANVTTLRLKKVIGKSKDGKRGEHLRPCGLKSIPKAEADRIRSMTTVDPKPADKMTIMEFAEASGTTRAGVDYRRRKGLLDTETGAAMTAKGYAQKRPLISRSKAVKVPARAATPAAARVSSPTSGPLPGGPPAQPRGRGRPKGTSKAAQDKRDSILADYAAGYETATVAERNDCTKGHARSVRGGLK